MASLEPLHRSIVINREFGSGGREIGRRIAERTGAPFYDSRILAEAAANRGLPADLLTQFDERVAGGQYFTLAMMTGPDIEAFSLPYRMYAAVGEVITAAAAIAPAIFIGRCADQILADAASACVACSSTAPTPPPRWPELWKRMVSTPATRRATSQDGQGAPPLPAVLHADQLAIRANTTCASTDGSATTPA